MRIIASAFMAIVLCSCESTGSSHITIQQPGAPTGTAAQAPPAPPAGAVPSVDDRRAAAGAVLDLLARHLSEGHLDYHFNASGEGVCLATAGLAFIGSGSTLGRGPYKAALTQVLTRIRQIMDTNDFPLQPSWGCAQSAIFLAEAHRTAPADKRDAIAVLLGKYIDKIIKAQTVRGSWCHTFEDVKNSLNYDDLMAVSVMAMQGLGMARREGLPIEPQVIEKGLAYISNSSDISSGHIGYSPREGQKGMAGPGRAGGGLLALAACGQARSPLSLAAATYLLQCFPGTDLNRGHASAQLSESWAAWWAAESGHYDRFWEGQGAAIMARRKPDGGFHCAPSDGNVGDPPPEMGDFANAMHALMLIAPEGFIFAGEAKDSPRAALEDALVLADSWGPGVPDCLSAFVSLKKRATVPSDAEIVKLLTLTIKALAKVPGERSGAAIMSLLGTSASWEATYDAKSRHITLACALSGIRLTGLVKAKVHIPPLLDRMISPPPDHALIPSPQAQSIPMTIAIKTGQDPGATVALEVTWDLAGMVLMQHVDVPILRKSA
jgi:hypothetical protein